MTYRLPSWQTLTITAVAALAVSALLAFSSPAVMIVDGQRVETDVPPVTTHLNRVYVPLRTLADALGAETVVDSRTGHIEVVRGTQMLRLKVGDPHATLNGMPLTLSHAPFRVRGRVMIDLNVVARAFDVRATYDPRTARIEVFTPGVGEAPEPKNNSEVTQ